MFPLQLPLVEEQDQVMQNFRTLWGTCKEVDPTKWLWNDWISPKTWWLIAHRAMLHCTSRLCQTGGHHLHCQIGASLCTDRVAHTANIGVSIDIKLAGGDVQEAFRHLKGWYWAATEKQLKPCYHIMDCQTSERVDLYAQRQSPGYPLPILVPPIKINDDTPSDGKIGTASRELSNGHAGGALGMHAEHVKAWLWGALEEEDPEGQGKEGHGDNWRLFIQLVQAVWNHGSIPCQLLWIIVVLIPKGDRDYCRIGLLEPIWKVLARIMDHRLNAIKLHGCLHSNHANRGTGTAVMEAKLVQQLLYLELMPFFSVFLDLKKAFNSMNREQFILILEGYRQAHE
jgi:hypothetical protein